MTFIHAMNTPYGKIDEYGARSRYIVEAAGPESVSAIIAKGYNPDAVHGGIDYAVKEAGLSLHHQLIRYSLSVLRMKDVQKKFVWSVFDSKASGIIKRMDISKVDIFHTWEWLPETIKNVKNRNSNTSIIRDVVVNRYYEYYSGTPITEENGIVDYFFSPSSFSTGKLVEWGIPETKIFEIPFGVDTSLFRPADNKPSEPFRFAFSGGISKRKGVDSLLRVWKRLDLPDAELHLYGRVRNDVKDDLNGAKNVICHGHIPLHEELPKNHVFVFPSTLEGSAKAVYEALASGLAVITTPDSGSIVRDTVDGYIVETGNDNVLADAVKKLYYDRSLVELMSSNARMRAGEYTWDRYADNVLESYRKILEKDR